MVAVPPTSPIDRQTSVRRSLSWALVAALCVAALTAIGAVLSGDFDDTDGRIIATSLGFAVFSATAASGASLRFRDSERLRTLGGASMALSGLSFLILLVALWGGGDEDAWRWFGSAALVALACSHASLVSGALRASDSAAVQALATASIALGVVDALFGILAISGAIHDIEERFAQLMAVLLILLLLTTALPPVLRRLQRSAVTVVPCESAAAEATNASRQGPPARPLAGEVLAAADRIEALNGDPGNRAPEIRRECERLRELVRSHPG